MLARNGHGPLHHFGSPRQGSYEHMMEAGLEPLGPYPGSDLHRDLRIRDLRHTAAALMIAESAHPEKIKRHLGHSSIIVTMDVYGHMFPAEDEVIAERLHERRLRAFTDKAGCGPSGPKHRNPPWPGNFLVGPAGLEPATNGL